MEATEENIASFNDFKEMMLKVNGAKIKYTIKKGKLVSNHDSEGFLEERDPIWKHAFEGGMGGNKPPMRRKIRKMTVNLMNMVIDKQVEENNEYSMKNMSLKFRNKQTKQWFEIDLIDGTVGFGNDHFQQSYEELYINANEEIRSTITNTLIRHFDFILDYVKCIVHRASYSSEQMADRTKNGVPIHNENCWLFIGNLNNRSMRIMIDGEQWNYIDIPLSEDQANTICDTIRQAHEEIAEEDYAELKTDLQEKITKKEKALEALKAEYANIDNQKKRRREEIEAFDKKFRFKSA